FCLLFTHRLPTSTLFPYTTLFRSVRRDANSISSAGGLRESPRPEEECAWDISKNRGHCLAAACARGLRWQRREPQHHLYRRPRRDRKSTRLNSSHLGISYAVFCLK